MARAARTVIRVGGLKDQEGRKEIEHNLIQIDGVREVRVRAFHLDLLGLPRGKNPERRFKWVSECLPC